MQDFGPTNLCRTLGQKNGAWANATHWVFTRHFTILQTNDSPQQNCLANACTNKRQSPTKLPGKCLHKQTTVPNKIAWQMPAQTNDSPQQNCLANACTNKRQSPTKLPGKCLQKRKIVYTNNSPQQHCLGHASK